MSAKTESFLSIDQALIDHCLVSVLCEQLIIFAKGEVFFKKLDLSRLITHMINILDVSGIKTPARREDI